METKAGMSYNDQRPEFHITPPAGWLNDPNGVCQINGIYHIYFQYAPLDTTGRGPKCWGEYISSDLMHFTYKGVCISPDTENDKNGAYSGCSYVEDGRQYIFYTGNSFLDGDYDHIHKGRESDVILCRMKDGRSAGKEILLTNADYPDFVTQHVRDPFVSDMDSLYRNPDDEYKSDTLNGGRYLMLLGARSNDDSGLILVYVSDDLTNWTYHNRITTSDSFGYMWECPAIFRLEDQVTKKNNVFISFCPQGIEELSKETRGFQNEYQALYTEADNILEDINDRNDLGVFRQWDAGFDFYAPHIFKNEAGQYILIAWAAMDTDEYDNDPTKEYGWIHMLTMPRLVTLKSGRVYQSPLPEFEKIVRHRIDVDILETGDTNVSYDTKIGKSCVIFEESEAYGASVENIDGRDLNVVIDGREYSHDEEQISLSYSSEEKTLVLKFGSCGRGRGERSLYVEKLNSLEYFVDRSIIEIFVNGGSYTMTSRFYMDSKIFINKIF
ncbi:MAG: glycoside hydrolase family 32 protein [Lachnospiraceae bacterium]|jgi:beta-fructofuranosidase|nr:glycoside hydrolase family 32 protein [Lachnospiraceae bacterium]MEE3460900.1 glycoside hydrolase family 32 protein [Lachnospiraceae bacterium]